MSDMTTLVFFSFQRIRIDYHHVAAASSSMDVSRAICRSVVRQLIQHTEALFPLKLSPSLRS